MRDGLQAAAHLWYSPQDARLCCKEKTDLSEWTQKKTKEDHSWLSSSSNGAILKPRLFFYAFAGISIPMRGQAYLSRVLEHAQQQKLIRVADVEVAARMFIGSLMNYTLVDGLILVEEPPRQPNLFQITAVVDLFLKALRPEPDQREDAEAMWRERA